MGDTINFDYYYGIEAEQFSFYRVPQQGHMLDLLTAELSRVKGGKTECTSRGK